MKDLRDRFPVYSSLLRLYPKQYRKSYEDQILLTTADMLDHAETSKEKVSIWTRIAFDLPINIIKQNYEYVGVSMRNTTPNYIKRNSLISSVLLLPFFLSILANTIDRIVYNHNLYKSWLWHSPAIVLWALYLPALAFIISLASYTTYVFKTNDKNKTWLKRAVNIINSWPVLAAGVVALGILLMLEFHDSTQCLVRSPLHAITHASKTLNCIESNRAIIPSRDFSL